MVLHPLIRFAAVATCSFALLGCGDGPSARHAAEDHGATAVVRGAAMDGSEDPVQQPAQESGKQNTSAAPTGGGVPTLPPDDPDPANGDAKSPRVASPGTLEMSNRGPAGPTLPVAGAPTPPAAPSAGAGPTRSAAPAGPLGKPDSERPEFLRLIFNDLASFDYDPFEAGVPSLGSAEPTQAADPDQKNAQIPESVLALNGKRVAVAGFMVPIEIRKDQAKSFLLVRNQMLCCFGVQIGFNEWIFVDMQGERRATFVPDVLVSVYGTLDVGEDIQDGMVMSIFRMKAEEVVHEGGK